MAGKIPKFGELNSGEHSQDAESLEPDNLDGIDLIAINNSKATKPNVIKKLVGPFKGIVLKGVGDQLFVEAGSSFFDFIYSKKLAKHRIRIPEIHAHLPEITNYDEVPQTVASLYPEFIADSTDIPSVKPGTLVWCNFLDRENMQEPIYLGPVDKQAVAVSSKPDPCAPIKNSILDVVGKALGLTAGNSATGDSPSGIQSSGQQTPSITTSSAGGAPGMYEIVTNGRSEGFIEMIYIEGTRILYPKKYIRALESLRQAYKKETGKILEIASGYRDVALQKKLYDQYLARNKAPPQVAPPGFSLHNSGRAADFGTGQVFNNNYERDTSVRPTQELAEYMVKQGKYGPVAKWLVENSRNYGYTWVGYSFRELWHYELDINLAKRAGLIDV